MKTIEEIDYKAVKIRKEVHTRTKFASQKYYSLLRKFVSIQKGNGLEFEDKSSFLYLSGKAVKKLHIDLGRCLSIYNHYSNEYNKNINP